MKLFDIRRLFGRREQVQSQECSATHPTYRNLFNAAVERTERMGILRDRVILVDDMKRLNKPSIDQCLTFARHEYPAVFSRGLALTAPFVHSGLIPAVEDFFSCRAYLTTGSMKLPRAEMYPLSEPTLERWLRDGVDSNKVQCHTWITLDSMEIINVTWPSTAAAAWKLPELDGGVIAIDPDSGVVPDSQLMHRPFVVGPEFLERIGLPAYFLEPLSPSLSPIH